VGDWLFTTRQGAERDLVDELRLKGDGAACIVAPGLVSARRAPNIDGKVMLTFARQGFPVMAVAEADSLGELAERLGRALAPKLEDAPAYALHVWVPDTDRENPLTQAARALEDLLEARLTSEARTAVRMRTRDIGVGSVPLVQVCLSSKTQGFGGVMASSRAISLAPGGRLRVHMGSDKPSRAARKIGEALAWLEVAPEPGEVCVDLGAAPGGWTWFLLERRARVIAVDPARLRPDLLRRKGLTYMGMSAFEFMPEEPVDWLFCDMAWRPLEVAQMLARWSRQRAASLLVANFKLPMTKKAEIVADIRKILENGGWRAVRTRQLYHDRDEITVTARLV
jgi:23S rRNA (cytidine2498-2'-O)-methyltransferase